MARQPQAAKRCRGGHRAEDHCPAQRRLHQRGAATTPGHDVVDLEGDTDAEQQRQRDDVGEVQRQIEDHAELQRHHCRQQQWHQRQEHVGDAAQRYPQQQGDRRQREDPGFDKGAHGRVAGFVKQHRRPRRLRLDRDDRADEIAQHRSVIGIALGQDLDARPAVRSQPLTFEVGRDRRDIDRLSLQRRTQPGERYLQRLDHRHLGTLARGGIGLRQLRQQPRQPLRRIAAGTAERGELRQGTGGRLQGGDAVLIARRRAGLRRVQRTLDGGRHLTDQRELLVLIGRDQVGERPGLRDLRQGGDTLRVGLRRGEIGRDDLDRTGAGFRLSPQFEKGGDRLGFRVLQMQRVEVERQKGQQGRQQQHDGEGDHDDRDPVLLQKPVDGGERGKAHRVRFAGRVEHPKQRRQQGDAGQKRDDHSGPGDLAQFREAAIIGRQKRGEADRGRRRGQRERDACLACGADQRAPELAGLVAFGAVAHAELDAEIDAEANKQYKKRDRDQVQRADQEEPERGRVGETAAHADHRGQDDARRAQCQPQDD